MDTSDIAKEDDTDAAGAGMAVMPTEIFEQIGMLTCLHQIKAADIALKRSQRPDVQNFARQMQNDYSDIAVKLMAFLGGLSAPHAPSQGTDPVRQIMLDELESADGGMFDALYIAQQKKALQGALGLFEKYSAEAEGELALRNLARLSRPVLQQHLEMLGELDAEAGGQPGEKSLGNYAPL